MNGSQIGRQVMDKNFKIRGMKSSESELFVLPTTDRSVGEAGEQKMSPNLRLWKQGGHRKEDKKTNTNIV